MKTTGASNALGSDLEWLRSVLWPEPDVSVTVESEPPPGYRTVLAYGAVPSARRPRLLVPLAALGARRTAFWQFNNGMTQRARIVKASAGVLAGLAPSSIVRDRIHVHVSKARTRQELGELLPELQLAEILGRDEVSVAVTFGSPRPNRKPVLLAMDRGGAPLAYMKVAWNALTADLVRNEGRALREWTDPPPSGFRVPRLIHEGRWRDRPVAVTRAFRHTLWRRGPLDERPGAEVVREVAERDGVGPRALSEVGLWGEVRARLDAAPSGELDVEAAELAARFEASAGDLEVSEGAWHGDWAPWNMSRSGTELVIWDWERARAGVPVGLDLVHFAFQLGLHRLGLDPVDAARRACALTDLPLRELGIVPDVWRALVCLYLFELYRRYSDGMSEGVAESASDLPRGVLSAIRRTAWPAA
jgi:hypothetical protein